LEARAGIAAAFAVAALPLLAGCGFTPLYATTGVTPAMAKIEVITPEGRTGHLLSEDLQDDLAIARGEGETAKYRLVMSLDERRYARGLDYQQVASWYELSLRVSYSLIDIESGKTLTAGVMPVSVSYNDPNDPYAGIVAQQDGQTRVANEAAQRIRIAIAAYFADQPLKTAGTNAGP
jgi:LPS-assembly lipoprotein